MTAGHSRFDAAQVFFSFAIYFTIFVQWCELVLRVLLLYELVRCLFFDPSHPVPFAGKRLARASARAHASGRPVTSHQSMTLHSPCMPWASAHTPTTTSTPRALVAQWIAYRTSNPRVAGSSPAVSVVRCVAPRTWVLGWAVLCLSPHYPSRLACQSAGVTFFGKECGLQIRRRLASQ